MAIDRADWHYGGDFPEELPDEDGGTHIGLYLAWVINNHLEGEVHHEDEEGLKALERVRNREITGRDFLFSACDEKFWDEDLNAEGLAFTQQYYTTEEVEDSPSYFNDYAETLLADLPTIYHIEDTWSNYDKISPVLDQRFAEWKSKSSPV